MSTRFRLPLAKKPTLRESGDQKGCVAPSVPASGTASSDWIERIHSNAGAPGSLATNTSVPPSGDTDTVIEGIAVPVSVNTALGGGPTLNRAAGADAGAPRIRRSIARPAMPRNPAMAAARQPRVGAARGRKAASGAVVDVRWRRFRSAAKSDAD